MSRLHADIRSHPSHYLVHPYTWPSDHFWLRHSKFHVWPWKFKVKVMAKVKPMVTFEAVSSSICLLFVSWQLDPFWLRYSKFHIWPWKFKVMVMVKPNGRIWGPGFYRYVCFSFRGNFWLRYSKFLIWPWKKVKVTTKIDQNLIR